MTEMSKNQKAFHNRIYVVDRISIETFFFLMIAYLMIF